MRVSGQLHTMDALPLEKISLYPLDRRLGGPQSRSGCGGEEENSQWCLIMQWMCLNGVVLS
jgi:hypothetical protein